MSDAASGPATPGRSIGGRFSEATDPVLERVNRSVEVDQRMWRQDIAGSTAHAQMLEAVGLLTAEEARAIVDGLAAVAGELDAEDFVFLDSDEDIHMAVERRLTEIIGAPARKLHTGRSRNDQVMTDVLLWLREALGGLRGELLGWAGALVDRAEELAEQPMASWTHAQPAQVSSAGMWLASHAVEVRDHVRRLDALVARLDRSPLGSGASAGTYLPIERGMTATALGFARPALNAIQATGSRAHLLDALGLLTLIGTSLSRLGEELVWMTTPMIGWVHLPDRLTTGSSLLPQKRNPDGAELLRGGGKLAAADFGGMASVLSGLVSGYSKDLQYDKELLFRSMDRTTDLVGLAGRHVAALSVVSARMSAACTPDLAALWLADQLVLKGLAFREAHHVVGLVARRVADEGLSMAEALASAADEVEVDVSPLVDALARQTPADLLAGLATEGSAAPHSVRVQVATLRQELGLA